MYTLTDQLKYHRDLFCLYINIYISPSKYIYLLQYVFEWRYIYISIPPGFKVVIIWPYFPYLSIYEFPELFDTKLQTSLHFIAK